MSRRSASNAVAGLICLLFQDPPLGFTILGVVGIFVGLIMLALTSDFASFCLISGSVCLGIGIILMIFKASNPSDNESEESKKEATPMNNQPAHELIRVEYNSNSHVAKVFIRENKYYQTIERYITRNYVKHPVYSDWKVKHREIVKNVKLTNAQLEALNAHTDPLIRAFAYDIVRMIGRKELYPSWFVEKEYRQECSDIIAKRLNEFAPTIQAKRRTYDKANEKYKEDGRTRSNLTQMAKQQIYFLEQKKENLTRSISRANARKKSTFLNVVTFGIYSYLCSESYRSKLQSNLASAVEEIAMLEAQIKSYEEAAAAQYEELCQIYKEYSDARAQGVEIQESETKIMEERISAIVPLMTSEDLSPDFILIRDFWAIDYKKIVGCYIIRNNENGKFYVGQSKDVIKRLRQHFKGTEPHNIIFAEDYYSSQLPDRSKLFSVRIMPCERSELDRRERELIAEYDAYDNGYNSTTGNL